MLHRPAPSRIVPALVACLLAALLAPTNVRAENARVEFVLLQEPGFPITGARRWIDALKRAGVRNVQVRSSRAREELKVEKRGTEAYPSFRVTAALTSRNTLKAPGVEFRKGDDKRLKNWVERLSQDGLSGISGARNAFGLSAKQLLQVQAELSRPVGVSTTEMTRQGAIRDIGSSLGLQIDPSLRFEAGDVLSEQFKGVSSGAALAILLRPVGGALTVVRTARGYNYVAADSKKTKESWPNGWPLEKTLPRDVAPKLFQFTEDVDIRNVPLDKLITALEPRLGCPVFFDHNSLTALEIDPAKVRVSLPAGRSYYKRILDRALTQARLKLEIRLDDNDKPLLWITTLKDPFRNR